MTTNSPNPVDGDVQALIRNIQRRIKNTKRWLSANKSIGNPENEAVELILIYETALAALTTPPAQLLRPVELPKKIERDDADGYWMHKSGRVSAVNAAYFNEAIKECAEVLRQQGYEVKS